jgi:uncharacterized protein (TIGR03067 family)
LRTQADAGGFVDKTSSQLGARPNLDHLRGQAKRLLKQVAAGDAAAAQAFIQYLPSAKALKATALRATKLKLADAQSVVARQHGFASWAILARHVEELRSLEGDWRITALEIEGAPVPANMLAQSRILFDGDRFRTESPEGNYEGIFTIDTEATPRTIDIQFVAGPEAGNWSYGIYKLGGADAMTLCLGLVGSDRPRSFETAPGRGHALEQLRRVSTARPENVTGGTPPPEPVAPQGDARDFSARMTPLFERLQGEWAAVELVTNGKQAPAAWLTHGSRKMTGNELEVVFGGQTMVHAKVRIDEAATPIAVDYLSLSGKQKGTVTHGIMEWVGDDVRFLMAPVGAPRPASFSDSGTLTRWRKR